jgi:tetratricopeptide (TPR) repeat protein
VETSNPSSAAVDSPDRLELKAQLIEPDTLNALIREERWEEIIRLVPDGPSSVTATAEAAIAAYRAHGKLGHPRQAEGWLDLALSLTPSKPSLHRDKGDLHRNRGEWADAALRYERAATLRPGVASYHGLLGLARYRLRDFKRAAVAYRTAVRLDASNRAWWLRLALSLAQINKPREAADAYTKALAMQDDPATRAARDELLRRIDRGTRTTSAAYYDAVFSESPKYTTGNVDSTPYAPVWTRIIDLLSLQDARRIVDLGCGPGQFAQLLQRKLPSVSYTGLDFSEVAITRARQQCPNFRFEVCELPTRDFTWLPAFDAAICTEVLEHVEHDCEILSGLPVGTAILASVPDFHAFGHLRIFRTEDEVRKRYQTLIDELSIERIALGPQSALWLFHGRRSSATMQL